MGGDGGDMKKEGTEKNGGKERAGRKKKKPELRRDMSCAWMDSEEKFTEGSESSTSSSVQQVEGLKLPWVMGYSSSYGYAYRLPTVLSECQDSQYFLHDQDVHRGLPQHLEQIGEQQSKADVSQRPTTCTGRGRG